jgi:ribonuclease G
MRRGIFIRANFDMEYEEYEIRSGTIEEFDRDWMGYRRAQAVEANVRRSSFENATKVVGWTDNGYYIELLDGAEQIGGRARVLLQDLRRSFAVGDVIMPGRKN